MLWQQGFCRARDTLLRQFYTDHDRLPEEIQAYYTENLSVMQNMRACHAQLVLLSTTEKQSSCPDNDRYPFVKEIIALDEKYHRNWQKYDEYPPVE